MKLNAKSTITSFLLYSLVTPQVSAAIALDRTRIIFNGNSSSVSLNISNYNKQLPYLAQGWIEDQNGNKIESPLVVLPPVQRIEPGKPSQIKIQAMPAVKQLPQDRETVFYFNLREIPPKSEKLNTLQIALQTRIKLFYRPITVIQTEKTNQWQERLSLIKQGTNYKVNNPTPYYVTIIDVVTPKNGRSISGFETLMVSPRSQEPLKITSALGASIILTYINDYGGQTKLNFICGISSCEVVPAKTDLQNKIGEKDMGEGEK